MMRIKFMSEYAISSNDLVILQREWLLLQFFCSISSVHDAPN